MSYFLDRYAAFYYGALFLSCELIFCEEMRSFSSCRSDRRNFGESLFLPPSCCRARLSEPLRSASAMLCYCRRSSLLTDRGLITSFFAAACYCCSFLSLVRLPDFKESEGVPVSWDYLCMRVSIRISAISDAFIRSTLI